MIALAYNRSISHFRSICNSVKRIRRCDFVRKNNKTAYAVSKETGISQSVLSDWKRGRSNPKVDKLQKLADYFGVSIEYFLEGQEVR